MSPMVIAKTLIRLEDVTCSFGAIHALKSVQFQVESGELVFVTGVSGAGKTTLLRVLCGELSPSRGRVQIATHSSSGQEIFIAPVFQDLRLMNDRTCESNILLSNDPNHYDSNKMFKREMMELCSVFGITDRLHVKIQDANGGLKQKVAIIRALLSKPDVLIADEPTSALDLESTRKVFEIINYYNIKKGMTIIWASHNRELVKQFSGRIAHLDQGRLVYSGHACFI